MDPIRDHTHVARTDFRREIRPFLTAYGIKQTAGFTIDDAAYGAEPVYLITGATFMPYSHNRHGVKDTHAIHICPAQQKYLMNNTAALVTQLLATGGRVICHSRDIATATQALSQFGPEQVQIVGGDLSRKKVLTPFYTALSHFAETLPIAEVRLGLYSSFAQSSGEPFKPIHVENVEEAGGAARRRLSFIYNMVALSYDLLVNRGQRSLRIVALSALASKRASYGLLADATDKVICDNTWKTFHIEANHHTGKPVSVFQINPGIVTAGDVYEGQAHKIVLRESIADGFPLSTDILLGRRDLPQMSSADVAYVAGPSIEHARGKRSGHRPAPSH